MKLRDRKGYMRRTISILKIRNQISEPWSSERLLKALNVLAKKPHQNNIKES